MNKLILFTLIASLGLNALQFVVNCQKVKQVYSVKALDHWACATAKKYIPERDCETICKDVMSDPKSMSIFPQDLVNACALVQFGLRDNSAESEIEPDDHSLDEAHTDLNNLAPFMDNN